MQLLVCSFVKKKLQHTCFPVKFLRKLFPTEHLWLLLLIIRNGFCFQLMIRVQDAMEPSKYIGHGICDSVSKAQTLP